MRVENGSLSERSLAPFEPRNGRGGAQNASKSGLIHDGSAHTAAVEDLPQRTSEGAAGGAGAADLPAAAARQGAQAQARHQ